MFRVLSIVLSMDVYFVFLYNSSERECNYVYFIDIGFREVSERFKVI